MNAVSHGNACHTFANIFEKADLRKNGFYFARTK